MEPFSFYLFFLLLLGMDVDAALIIIDVIASVQLLTSPSIDNLSDFQYNNL